MKPTLSVIPFTDIARNNGNLYPQSIDELKLKGSFFQRNSDKLLSCVVGKNHFNALKHTMLLSSIASVSDEAFYLLVIENSFQHWKDEFEKPQDRQQWASTKYTVRAATAKKYGGWSIEGRKQYNHLQVEVVLARKEEERQKEEKAAKQQWEDSRHGRKRKYAAQEEEVVPLYIVEDTDTEAQLVGADRNRRVTNEHSESQECAALQVAGV